MKFPVSTSLRAFSLLELLLALALMAFVSLAVLKTTLLFSKQAHVDHGSKPSLNWLKDV